MWSSPMLDANAYEPLLTDHTGTDLIAHVDDPGLLKALATLEEDLRMVVGQIASNKMEFSQKE
jgi:hypothetical protein